MRQQHQFSCRNDGSERMRRTHAVPKLAVAWHVYERGTHITLLLGARNQYKMGSASHGKKILCIRMGCCRWWCSHARFHKRSIGVLPAVWLRSGAPYPSPLAFFILVQLARLHYMHAVKSNPPSLVDGVYTTASRMWCTN
jgi:hypothetical protein